MTCNSIRAFALLELLCFIPFFLKPIATGLTQRKQPIAHVSCFFLSGQKIIAHSCTTTNFFSFSLSLVSFVATITFPTQTPCRQKSVFLHPRRSLDSNKCCSLRYFRNFQLIFSLPDLDIHNIRHRNITTISSNEIIIAFGYDFIITSYASG